MQESMFRPKTGTENVKHPVFTKKREKRLQHYVPKISTGVSFYEFVSVNTSCAFSPLVTPISSLPPSHSSLFLPHIYLCMSHYAHAARVLVNTGCMCKLWCDGITLVWGCLVGVV